MDIQRFLNQSLSPRTSDIEVPELASWFPEGQAIWTVRGLTASEVARAKTASDTGMENVRKLTEALAGSGDKAAAMQKMIGVTDKGSDEDFVYRIELLCSGSVSPDILSQRDVAVKLSEAYPIVFYKLTNAILTLTGQGADIAKPKPSGTPEKSDP